jgi:hypothetical protein
MSKLRDLIEQGPKLVGAINHERWSKALTLQFDHEVKNKNSVFAAKKDETTENRLETLNGLYVADGVDAVKTKYLIDLINLYSKSYSQFKGQEGLSDSIEYLANDLQEKEKHYLDISKLCSVNDAKFCSEWN